jgi:Rieske 2Fe-2S family protein
MKDEALTANTVQSGSIRYLLAARSPGHGLARDFYTRADVFEADLSLLGDRWLCAGHVSEAPRAGDWLTAELGADSAIVVRGEDGALRALANVCRHRGSRICDGAHGHSTVLTCPYHAWSYRLDGALRAAREMPPGFDPGDFALKPLPLTVIGGLIFISFGASPPAIGEAGAALAVMTGLYDWTGARVAARRSYAVAANWKLVMENYHECYHCGPAHPEFAILHALARPGNRALSDTPDPATGLADIEAWGPEPDGREVVRVMRSALAEGCETGAEDGRRLAPPMGAAGARWDASCVFAELGFLSAFLAYADHGLIYRFIPRGPTSTQMEVIWLVAGEAQAGRDYDPAALTWLWDVTSLADKRIIERNQAGVASRAYEPGPFSLMEPGTAQYVARYAGELARLVGLDEEAVLGA